MSNTSIIEVSPPTVASFFGTDKLDKLTDLDEITESKDIVVYENNILEAVGNFDNFQLYFITTYNKFFLIEGSLKIINSDYFEVDVRFNYEDELIVEKVRLKVPKKVKNCQIEIGKANYGYDYLRFISPVDNKSRNYHFNLTFLIAFADKLTIEAIPLYLKYIGTVETSEGNATKRIVGTHHQIENILSEIDESVEDIAFILYRITPPEGLEIKAKTFNRMVEASLIQYFRPKHNHKDLEFPSKETNLVDEIKNINISRSIQGIRTPKYTTVQTKKVAKRNSFTVDVYF